MEAIILAGGFGTRLSHIISDVPKPMAPIKGKPFLETILNDCFNQGFTRLILAVGYKSEVIINYFGTHYKHMELIYSYEDKPLGTGGAIKKALTQCIEEVVFVINGDTFFHIDYQQMKNHHMKEESEITLAVKPMKNYDRYGSILVENNCIAKFTEKKFMTDGLINGGIYCLNSNLVLSESDSFSFETQILESMKFKMLAYLSDGYFIDIGIPEDYYKAEKDLQNGI